LEQALISPILSLLSLSKEAFYARKRENRVLLPL
jgi:hypothetical protein